MSLTVPSGPLSGLTVLDLSAAPAGAMASMLLSDSGADVLRVETGAAPEVDPVAYRVWHRGKRSIALDLGSPGHVDALRRLAATADVLIESFAPQVAAGLGLDAPALARLNPRIVSCSIAGYLPGDSRPAYDSLVAARTGLQWEQRGVLGTPMNRISGAPVPLTDLEVPDLPANRFGQEGPVFIRSLWPSVGTAYLATAGISAALRAREVTGRGDHVETSLLRGAMAAAGPNWQRAEHPDAPGFWMWVSDRRAPEGLFECADGRWVHFWTIRPTLVLEAAEGDQLQIDGPRDNMRAGDGVRIGMDADDLVVLYFYYGLLAEAFRKFPSDQWVAFGAARSLGIVLVHSPEEAFSDPALLKQGCVTEVSDPELGPIRHAGVLLEFAATPGAVRGPAPRPGEHTAEVLASLEAPERPAAPQRATAEPARADARLLERGPLDGIRVLDLGLGVAGPWGGRVLADLGADVIKVHAVHDGYWTRTHMGLATNWGKRSIALNLKDPAARAVLGRLLETADVVAHNMRPGAAERLGIGYERLRDQFPGLIYCHTRGFEDGPRSTRPGTDQTANALAGTEYEDGGCVFGMPPLWSRINLGDTGNGYLWAIAVMQALYHRERTGQGQLVGGAIINATLLLTSYALSRADGSPVDRPRIDARQRGLSALHGLYRLADDQWACIAVLTDDAWADLCHSVAATALLDDSRFATDEARRRHDAELRAALEPVFAQWTAAGLAAVADKHGLPCEIVSDRYSTELFDDPEIRRRGWIATARVPGVGRLEQPGLLIDLERHPGGVVRGPCLAGEHTREILTELGYDTESVARLERSGAVLTANLSSLSLEVSMPGTDRLISVDSHYRVTLDMLKEAVPARYRDDIDAANRLVEAPKLAAMQRRGSPPLGLGSYLHEAARHPGYSDPAARVEAMNEDGVEVEILFSDLSAFRIVANMLDGWRETARAFTDLSTAFADTAPDRLLVAYQIPLRDMDLAVAELERLAGDHHARTVHLPTKPSLLGLPDYYHERYDPLWARLQEMSIPVCIHLGVEDELWEIASRDPTPQLGVFTSQPAMRLSEQLGLVLLSGLFERFPGLRFVFVEPGLGWVPFYLDTLDRMVTHGYDFPALKDKPSAYFHRNVFLTFMDERRGVEMRHDIGVENIMWSTDFPHPACTWPNSRKVVADLMRDVPDNEAYQLVYGNAARVFSI